MLKKSFFYKFVKIALALRALPPDPFGFRRLGIRSRLVFVTSLYLLQLFIRPQF